MTGTVLGAGSDPSSIWVRTTSIMIATVIWFILTIISFSSGDQIFLSASKAVAVTHKVHPQLFNVVEEMAIAANLPMPKVYIINDPAPNAFATGRNPSIL